MIVAIVGARNASTNGFKFASYIAKELGKSGVRVASGLARGIDSAAHAGSLETGSIAVIAGGVDNIYPKENAKLYHELKEKGAILSELPIGTAPLAQHFPQRNRIISGMAKVVAVIEAAKESGSLITADFAVKQGKQVFAVPGSPLDSRYAGTNYLLKNGRAKFLEAPLDIMNFLGTAEIEPMGSEDDEHITKASELDNHRELLLKALSFTPCPLNDVAKMTEIPIDILNLLLVELELAGKIERSFGNQINLIK